MVYGLTIANSIYKSIIRLDKREYKQGTYAPNSSKTQSGKFSLRTPSGMLGRGVYAG